MRLARSAVVVAVGTGVLLGAAGLAHADPVPVLPVVVAGVGPARDGLAAAVQALGGEALAGAVLAQQVEARFGRVVPAGDPLAAARGAVEAAVNLYFDRARGARDARARLLDAVGALERDPEALVARDDNRAARFRALATLARIALEARQPDEADGYLQRIAAADPDWAPDPREFPPVVVRRYQDARTRVTAGARGAVVASVPEGCELRLDGHAFGNGAVVPGDHLVLARCAGGASRAHPVHVAEGSREAVAIDPVFDAALVTTGGAALRYASAAAARRLARDAAELGAALGVHQVVAVQGGGYQVVDVARRRVSIEVPVAAAGELYARVHGIVVEEGHGRAGGGSEVALRRVGAGVGPWVLMSVGAATVAAGVVFLVLRGNEVDTANGLCPQDGSGSFSCASMDLHDQAQPHADRASTYTMVAGVTLAAGGAAVVGGLLWFALGGRSERASGSAAAVQVGALPGGAGVSVRGVF